MSKKSKHDMNEMVAGDGSSLQLPPAFVMVNPRQNRKYKKSNKDKVDGRTSGARALFNRIQRRKMKEQLEPQLSEAVTSETERGHRNKLPNRRNLVVKRIFRKSVKKQNQKWSARPKRWMFS